MGEKIIISGEEIFNFFFLSLLLLLFWRFWVLGFCEMEEEKKKKRKKKIREGPTGRLARG